MLIMRKLKIGVVYKEKASLEEKLKLAESLRTRVYQLLKKSREEHEQAARDIERIRMNRNYGARSRYSYAYPRCYSN